MKKALEKGESFMQMFAPFSVVIALISMLFAFWRFKKSLEVEKKFKLAGGQMPRVIEGEVVDAKDK